MRNICQALAAVMIAALAVFPAVHADETKDTVRLPATAMPELKQVIGRTAVKMGPTRYPTITKAEPQYPMDYACRDYLMTKPGIDNAKLPDNLISQKDFETIDGMVIKNLKIAEANRGTSKLLITWTVRIEGEGLAPAGCEYLKTGGYNVWKCICQPKGMNWHGTTKQLFKGGKISTRLYINGKYAPGAEASMTMPDAAEKTVVQLNDPTVTGSFLLTRDFFGKSFPAKIDTIEVRWFNDTALKITTPANMRSIIIKIMPVTTSN